VPNRIAQARHLRGVRDSNRHRAFSDGDTGAGSLCRHHIRPALYRCLFVLNITFFFILSVTLGQAGEFSLTNEAIAKITEEHGKYAGRRVKTWQDLINSGIYLSDAEKLEKVNQFFNRLKFVNDIDHWGKEDYWATPLQTLVTNGGDCEDFSIAKYFTLREMGVSDELMRLTYVKALELNQAHMVLTYYPSQETEPLILDNLVDEIKPSDERDDLLPVYSFNGDGLWLAKSRLGEAKHVGRADRLGPWRDVIARINDELSP
jgi:predicted transglutaminase-like cysteine proteinase